VSLTDVSKDQESRLRRIASQLEEVINSEQFKNSILGSSFNKTKGFYQSSEPLPETYKKIMSGEEKLTPKVDYKWNLSLSIRSLMSRTTVAYTESGSPTIYFNSKFYNVHSDAKVAGTICHEYTHKLGYGHDKKPTPLRPYTIPYMVGSYCESIYSSKFKTMQIRPVVKTCGIVCRLQEAINVHTK
jgi:hypothetical protein